ncbi:DAG7 [Candida margitis]|uniref:DAG7 n=1 Tax=Candida margitis TaxID=1775924 RepID=UPI0022264206|nr:DAG7 [Candida margitis]KAI5970084.1 DAG7 [Candida margitis]
MKFSTVLFAALLSLSSAAPAPEVHTVFITAYTTVVVDQSGVTHTPTIATTETADVTAATQQQQQQQQFSSANDDQSPAAAATSTSPAKQQTTLTSQTIPSSSAQLGQGTSPSSTSSQTSSASSSSSEPSGAIQSGEGTYYSTGLGACGKTSQDTDYIIAISHEMYDAHNVGNNPNNNPLCGKKIRAYYEGNSVDVTVVDRCEGCSYNDLDFSPSAFSQLADQSLGRIDITWEWL